MGTEIQNKNNSKSSDIKIMTQRGHLCWRLFDLRRTSAVGGKFKSLDGVLVLGIAADRVIATDRDVVAIVPESHGQGDPDG